MGNEGDPVRPFIFAVSPLSAGDGAGVAEANIWFPFLKKIIDI